VYKSASASGLWLWVNKSDLLMANSTKTFTHIHIEEVVGQSMLLITAHSHACTQWYGARENYHTC